MEHRPAEELKEPLRASFFPTKAAGLLSYVELLFSIDHERFCSVGLVLIFRPFFFSKPFNSELK